MSIADLTSRGIRAIMNRQNGRDGRGAEGSRGSDARSSCRRPTLFMRAVGVDGVT